MADQEKTRITIEIPAANHKRMKMIAAAKGETMKTIVNDVINKGLKDYNAVLGYDKSKVKSKKARKKPQKETIKGEKKYVDNLEIPENEKWLYAPENKDILDALKESLSQKPTIYRGSFIKYLKK